MNNLHSLVSGDRSYYSPYQVTSIEVINKFASTPVRKRLLKMWLAHRAGLRKIGFVRGFQWLDGSFVENKEPNDLDIVSFLFRPEGITNSDMICLHIQNNPQLFSRQIVREKYGLHFFPVDLNGTPKTIIDTTSYFFGLFSHRRNDHLWKGILEVNLEESDEDQAALTILNSTTTSYLGEAE